MEPAAGIERLIVLDQPAVGGLDAQDDSALLTVNPLGSLLRRCVVRVAGDGEFSGSGFLVAPGQVPSCAHVVHGRGGLTVAWGGTTHQAAVSAALPELAKDDPAARFYPLPDVALLRLMDPPREHPCVRVDLGEPALGRKDHRTVRCSSVAPCTEARERDRSKVMNRPSCATARASRYASVT